MEHVAKNADTSGGGDVTVEAERAVVDALLCSTSEDEVALDSRRVGRSEGAVRGPS